MPNLFSSVSRSTLIIAAAMLVAPMAARAESFTVPPASGQQKVSGNDLGEVLVGGVLDTTADEKDAIVWDDPAGTTPGVRIINDGTIRGGDRGIDTSGEVGGSFYLENNGAFTAVDDVFRIDDAFVGGSVRIVNTRDMTALANDGDGGQVIDFGAVRAPDAQIEIENSGTIWAQENAAIKLNGGVISITNSGTIKATLDDDDARAIDVGKDEDDDPDGALTSFSLTNKAGGVISAIGDDAIKMGEDLANADTTILIDNSGTIRSASGQAIDFADLGGAGEDIRIINRLGAVIESETADAMRPGAGAKVTNSGIIRSTDLTSDGDGVDFQGFGGTVENTKTGEIYGAKHGVTGKDSASVTNYGTIIGRNGSGINFDTSMESDTGQLVTVINHGTIRGEVTGLYTDEDEDEDHGDPNGLLPDGDGDGVDVDGKLYLENYGRIEGAGAVGTKDGDPNTPDGIAAGGGTILNYKTGLISGRNEYTGDTGPLERQLGRAILIDDSEKGDAPFATTIKNWGEISSEAAAITIIGDKDDVIENWGVIKSDAETAVFMGKGADRFVYHAGSLVDGLVDGGEYDRDDNYDVDTIELVDAEGTIDLAQFVRFETLVSTAGSDFIATGENLEILDVTVKGRLIVNGGLNNADAVVENGGVLGGTGVIGLITVNNGGAVAPGNSIGTLTTGDINFQAGSFYDVEIDRTTSDQIVVDDFIAKGSQGKATIDSGAVARLSSAGGPLRDGTEYVIVAADELDAEDGAFNPQVQEDFLFLDATVESDFVDNEVLLTIDRNKRSFASVGESRNQVSVGNALDDADGDEPLIEHLLSATDEKTVRRSYDLLSGEVHASLGTVLYGQNTLVADTLIGRMRQAPAGSTGALAALGFGGPVTAYATKAPEPAAFKALKAPAAPAPGPVYAMWAQGFGQWSSADGNNNAAEVDGSLGGFLAGGDVTVSNFTFGLAAGYSSADVDVDDRLSSASADTVMIAAYGAASFDAFRLRAGGSYGWSDIDSHRTAIVGNLIENPTASYDGSTANLFAEAANAFETAGVAFEPYAQLGWSRVETDSFTEQNAPITGLTSAGLSFDTTYTTLGARVATSFEAAGGTFTPHVGLGWRHAFGDVTPEVAMDLISTGTGFLVAGTPIAEDSLVVGAGIDFNFGANFSLNIGYEGQFADEVEYNALKGGLTYRF